jgi:hypothetical protein
VRENQKDRIAGMLAALRSDECGGDFLGLGKVSASWKKSGGSATVNVTIPANTTARLELPGKTENLSSGTYTFTVKLP